MSSAKPRERRQRRGGSPTISVVPPVQPDEVLIPFPPTGLLPETVASWDAYWLSSLAQQVTMTTDLPALRRLFRMYDDLDRSWAIYLANPEVEGSTGQTRISHFAKHIAELEPLVRNLEDRFGLSPKARLELGVVLGDAARSLEDLYREATTDSSIPDDLFVPGASLRVAGGRRV